MIDWIIDKTKCISDNRIITIMQKSIISVSPILLVASILLLVAELPFEQWKVFLGSENLDKLYILSDIGLKLLSVYLIVSCSYWTFITKENKPESMQCIPCVITSLFILLMISGKFSLTGRVKSL